MTTDTVLTDEELRSLQGKHLNTIGPRQVRIDSVIKAGRAIEQAVLQSAEVQALRMDAERYRFCRSQFSHAEIHIHGVELGLAGDSLDEAMDAEMKEWKS